VVQLRHLDENDPEAAERARRHLRARGALRPADEPAPPQWAGVDHIDLVASAEANPDRRLWCGHTAADVVAIEQRRRIPGRRHGEVVERVERVEVCGACQAEAEAEGAP
jgi:hypothetical protein